MKAWFKKFLPVVLLLASAGIAGATTAFFVTTAPVARIASFWTSTQSFDSLLNNQEGGEVRTYLATDSVWICNVVHYTALTAGRIAKPTTTIANYNLIAGVVVGGARTSNQGSVDSADCGTLAATANQRVIVMRRGRFWTQNDGSDSLRAGALILPSDSVRGLVENKPATLDSLARGVGRVVMTVAKTGGAVALTEINIR